MTEYEFSADRIPDAFGGQGLLGLFEGCEATPEEFAEYLNNEFDTKAKKSLRAMRDNHIIPLQAGGHLHIEEQNSYDAWAEKADFSPDA